MGEEKGDRVDGKELIYIPSLGEMLDITNK